MQTRKITKADFDQIVEVIDRWWGGPISTFAHPIFFYELGDNALIVEHDRSCRGIGEHRIHATRPAEMVAIDLRPRQRQPEPRALYAA